MRYDTRQTEELAVIKKAIRFANMTPPEETDPQWAEQVKRKTGVVGSGPKSRYWLGSNGQVVEEPDTLLDPDEAERQNKKLRGILRKLLNEPHWGDPYTKPKMEDRKIQIDFGASRDIWIRHVVRGNQILPSTQRAITPTLRSFVAYACVLLSRDPWRQRLTQCTECDRFFLSPIRKGGRKKKTCRVSCKQQRKRNQGKARQKKARDQGSFTTI